MIWILTGAQSKRAGWRGLLLLALVTLGGCSLFNPYIDAERTKHETVPGDPFPALTRAANDANDRREKAIRYRDQHVETRSVLGYSIFGAAAAGGVAALYDAHPDLVLGLGLGATGGFTAGELFVGTDKIAIYSAAAEALYCVVATADGAVAVGKSQTALTAKPSNVQTPTDSYWKLDDHLGALLKLKWPDASDQAAVTAGRQARAEYAAARVNLTTFKALDFHFATVADKAVAAILHATAQRIRADQTGLDGVLRAAEGIGASGVAYAKRVTPTPPEGVRQTFSPNERTQQERSDLAWLTAQVKQAAAKVNESVTGATNGLGQIGAVCVLKLPTAAPLSINQAKVTIGKEQIVKLVASGGKLPLIVDWLGVVPNSNQLEVPSPTGREIFLFGKTGLADGDSFTLRIYDSRAAPGEVTVEIGTATAKLAVNEDKVTVKKEKGAIVMLTLTGGKKPYKPFWPSNDPNDPMAGSPEIVVTVADGTVTLTSGEGLVTGDEHDLLLSDSAVPPQTVSVMVTIAEGE